MPTTAGSKQPARTKRASTSKRSAGKRRNAKARNREQQGAAVSPEQRLAMIAEAAYFRAEARGFVPGEELQDWLDAEKEVDTRLLGM